MLLSIDPTSPVAPFEQIRSQITAHVAAGTLTPGSKLPTVRHLADDLGLAVNTVARAYRELERGGVLETRGRHGTFIASSLQGVQVPARHAAQEYVKRIRDLGYNLEDAITLVTEAFRN